MKRREFIAFLGGAAAWPLPGWAQQSGLPVVGMLNSGNSSAYTVRTAVFLKALSESGFIEGRNIAVAHLYADDHYERLPELAAKLVSQGVAVIFAAGGGVAPQAAKAATGKIPIVFTGGFDPVQTRLVTSLNRPGGNVTGVTFLTNGLEAKRLGLLHELVPQATAIGVLLNPKNISFETARRNLSAAAGDFSIKLRFAQTDNASQFDAAFADLDQAGIRVLLVASDSVFSGSVERLVSLAEHYKMTAMYFVRDFAVAGGLMSYGTSFEDAYRQAGRYVARILNGEKPGDLPVVQSTKFEFVINLKTAKSLGLTVPNELLAIADEVIT